MKLHAITKIFFFLISKIKYKLTIHWISLGLNQLKELFCKTAFGGPLYSNIHQYIYTAIVLISKSKMKRKEKKINFVLTPTDDSDYRLRQFS